MHIDARSNSTHKRYMGGLDLIREQSSMSIKSAPESPTKKIITEDLQQISDSSKKQEPEEDNNDNDDLNECRFSESQIMCDNSDDWRLNIIIYLL